MKDQDLFSNAGSPPTEPQNPALSTASPPMEPRLAPGHHVRLLLVALVVLIILAGGYGIFRAVSPPPRQTSSAFKTTHCPFPLGAGLVEGQDVKCGFLTVPEDRSLPKSPTLRLAVAIFQTPYSQRGPDPVLFLTCACSPQTCAVSSSTRPPPTSQSRSRLLPCCHPGI